MEGIYEASPWGHTSPLMVKCVIERDRLLRKKRSLTAVEPVLMPLKGIESA